MSMGDIVGPRTSSRQERRCSIASTGTGTGVIIKRSTKDKASTIRKTVLIKQASKNHSDIPDCVTSVLQQTGAQTTARDGEGNQGTSNRKRSSLWNSISVDKTRQSRIPRRQEPTPSAISGSNASTPFTRQSRQVTHNAPTTSAPTVTASRLQSIQAETEQRLARSKQLDGGGIKRWPFIVDRKGGSKTNNGVVKTQTKFEAIVDELKNTRHKNNNSAAESEGMQISTGVIRSEKKASAGCSDSKYMVTRSQKLEEKRIATGNGNAGKYGQMYTDDVDERSGTKKQASPTFKFDKAVETPDSSASSRSSGSILASRDSSLSRKSIVSRASVASQGSLIDKILESRDMLNPDLIRTSPNQSGSLDYQLSAAGQHLGSRRSSIRSETNSFVSTKGNLSDSGLDLGEIKKHLPDVVPQDGENTSPIIKRKRSRRKILQS